MSALPNALEHGQGVRVRLRTRPYFQDHDRTAGRCELVPAFVDTEAMQ